MPDSSLYITSNILNTIYNKEKVNNEKKNNENKFLIDKHYSKTWLNNYFKK